MSLFAPRRKAPSLLLLLFVIVAMALAMVGSVAGEGAPHAQVPGYPKYGCYDVATGGIGMWSGNSPYPLAVDVPGPVVDAYLVWIGTEDVGAPDSPNQSDLTVNGATVVGTLVDEKKPGASDATWYMWRADVGPGGANLVAPGLNKLSISGWGYIDPTDLRRNGVALVVVYDTGSCTRPNQVNLVDDMDFYWERLVNTEEGTTDAFTFTFPPAPVDRDATLWLHHAGTDHVNQCRQENLWAAIGAGTPPAQIVDYYANPPVGVNGGKRVVENAFVPATCGSTTFKAPVTALVGWVDGMGPTPNVGGFVSPEWSFVRLTVRIPAGATWLVVQGESEKTGAAIVTETGESGAIFGQFVIPLYNPELKVTKTDGIDLADPGDELTYTIDYENYGYGAAENTVILDQIPERASYVSATNGGVYDAATRTVKWELGTVDIGAKGQVAVTVKLDPVYPPGTTTITNEVSISTTTPGELDPSDNQATDSTDVFAKAELAIDKKAAPEPVDAGSNLTYTVDWTVGGNAFAGDVTIVDTLPDDVTFVSASDAGLYDPGARTVTWLLGDVTPLTEGSYQVVVQVNSPLYNGTKLDNAVVITDKEGDTAQDSVTSTVRSSHVLAISKTAAPDPVDAGSNLTYTVNWAVTGNEPADDATIVDTLPAGVVFVSASDSGVYDSVTRTVTWKLGEVMTPQNGSLTVVVTVPAPQYNGATLTNVVDFSDKTPGSTPAQTTLVTTIRADHELSIIKDDSPDPVEKGAELTYTISWRVTGNEFADDIVITDAVPFGTKFVSASDGGTFDPGTNIVTWLVGDKVPGDEGIVTLVVKVNKDFPNGYDITNTVAIADYKPGKGKDFTAVTSVVQTAEGTIGDTVWYDTNSNGIQEPGEPGLAGVSLILYSAGPDGACGTGDDTAVANTVTDASGKYTFGAVPAGVYCVDVVDATVPAGLVLVSGADPHGPITLAEGQVYKAADFGYVSAAGTAVIGDRVWSDADGDGVQDPGEVGIGGVTLNLVNVGPDGVCGTADDVVTASTSTAADGSYLFAGVAPGAYCVDVTDTGNVLAGLTLSGGTDPSAKITVIAGGAYLDADFGYQGRNGQIGNLVFYDGNRSGVYDPGPVERGVAGVTLSLLGPGPDGVLGTADDVTIATTTTDANGGYLFTGLADGTYHVVVTDLNGRLVGYTQTYGLPDTNNNGQPSPYAATITGGSSVLTADFAYADGHLLSISKDNDVTPGQPVEAGADMVYTISYSVSGREAAINVVIKDPLPTQLEFLEASDGGTYDAVTRVVTWNLGTLQPGDTGSVTVKVHVKKPLPNNSYIFNTATIIDDAKVTDEATDMVRVHAEPILSLTKTVTPTGQVKPGDMLTYNICFSNTGNGNATNVVLRDMLPTFTTIVPDSYPAEMVYDAAARTLMQNLGTLPPDYAACVSFKVTVDLTIPGVTEEPQIWTVTNIAHLDSQEKPRLTAEASNPLSVFVKPTLSKTADPAGEVKPGDKIKYMVCFGNEGTANITGAVLTDVIPINTTYVPGSATNGAVYNEATKTLTWSLGTIAPLASGCGTFEVTVNMTIVGLTGQANVAMSFAEWNALTITNSATLKTDQAADKVATASNPLNATVKPAIYKTVNTPLLHTGETAVFTVTATNTGTANATNVVISDVIHPKLENVTLTSTKGTTAYDPATRTWTVTIGTLAPGETVVIVITGQATRVPTAELPYQITNVAQFQFTEGVPRDSNEVIIDVVYFLPGEVPEPGTWLMLGSGLAGLAGYASLRLRSRRRKDE